jgi:F-type H+-transporting ATPase subunit b
MKKVLMNVGLLTVLILLSLVIWGDIALADQVEQGNIFQRGFSMITDNRPTWDLIMRWVNFLILAFVIIKYSRAPIAQFLKEKRSETSLTIKQLEEKKQAAERKIQEGQAHLQASRDRLTLIKERIVAEGRRRKERIIEDARQESRLMLAAAQVRIENQIRDAAKRVRHDLIDKAAELAEARLPKLLAEQDHHRLVKRWLDAAVGPPPASSP